MQSLARRVIGRCLHRLGVRRPAPAPLAYWTERARAHGPRSVLNLGHAESEYEAVTMAQKRELFPHLARCLTGQERVALDFGCGPGRFTADLADRIKGRAIGVDVVLAYLDMAAPHERVEYRPMDPGRIDLADGSVDLVWVCLVLGALREPVLSRSAAEIARVLRTGGLLFVVENTSEQPDAPHWTFRPVAEYQRLFPWAALRHIHDYRDLGERISVLAGRKS
ncbi:MAG: class I SAM-dependent methyltransferase [Candidatus Rokubacteria bacterium]|nr:class I SAM-dependent methyltransferase [Candidatus Rokubacteria bacterium]